MISHFTLMFILFSVMHSPILMSCCIYSMYSISIALTCPNVLSMTITTLIQSSYFQFCLFLFCFILLELCLYVPCSYFHLLIFIFEPCIQQQLNVNPTSCTLILLLDIHISTGDSPSRMISRCEVHPLVYTITSPDHPCCIINFLLNVFFFLLYVIFLCPIIYLCIILYHKHLCTYFLLAFTSSNCILSCFLLYNNFLVALFFFSPC